MKIKLVNKFYVPEMHKKFNVYSMVVDDKETLFSITDKVYEAYSYATMGKPLFKNRIVKNRVVKYLVTAFSGLDKKILSEKDTGRYVIRKELVKFKNTNDKPTEMESCYNYKGHYIGNIKDAQFICDKMEIAPEAYESNNVCCIGYCEKDKKWYGWSHRAIVGFKIGDKIFEERFGNDNTPFVKHGSKTIETIEEAKLAAINFAKYIG